MSNSQHKRTDILRKRAETLLALSPSSIQLEHLSDVRGLAQELAINQAELELQNEELQEAQIALQESKDRFAALFENAPVGYVILDGYGIIRQTNATWRAMLNRENDDLRSTPFTDTIVAEDAPVFLARFRTFFRNPAKKQIDLRMKRRSGPPFHARIEAASRKLQIADDSTADASRMELMVTISDISESKQAEKALEESRKKLKEAHRLAGIGIWDWVIDTGAVHWSEELYAIFGRDEKLPAPSFPEHSSLFVPESWERLRKAIERTLESGRPYQLELQVLRPDGSSRWVNAFGGVTCDSEQRVVGFNGTVQDITERKRAEELVRVRLRLLEFSASHSLEDLLQKTLDEIGALANSPIGFYHFVESDQKTLSLQAWSTRTEKEFCQAEGKGLHYSIEEAGVWVDCVRERRPVIHNDYPALPHRKGLPEGHAPVLRELVVPIMRSDRIVAIIGIGNKPTDYTSEDVDVVSYLADVAWEITKRKRAERELGESETRYRTLFEEAIEGIALIDDDTGEIIDCNRSFLDLTGYEHQELLGKPQSILYQEKESVLSKTLIQKRREKRGPAFVGELVTKSGTIKQVEIKGSRLEIGGSEIVQAFFRDISPELRYQHERETTLRLLQLMNSDNDTHELIRSLTGFLQEWTGCEAVGVRLQAGEDFPYFETLGFPLEFVEAESSLCVRDSSGEVITDCMGNPVLECMCGNILRGRFNPALPFFTHKGSFWTNSTSELLSSTSEKDRQARTRNRCNGEGYESVALIPLRVGLDTLGLLQINDRKKNRFSPEVISFMENAADQIAMALSQRASKAALKVSEQRFRDVSEAAGEFIWEMDREGRRTYVSERVESVLGYRPEELLGKPVYGFVDDEEMERCRAFFENQCQAGDGFRDFEYRILTKSGSSVRLSASAVPILGPAGEVLGLRGATLDITERKQAEEILRESEEKLRSILRAAPIGIGLVRDRVIIEANEHLCMMTGYPQEELLGKSSRILYPTEEHYKEVGKEKYRRISEKGTGTVETKWQHRDGTVIDVLLSSTPIHQKNLSAGVTFTAIDISERKRAEEALKTSEERYRSLVESSSDWIWETDAHGRYTHVSSRVKQILGYAPEEVLGHTPFDFMPEDEAQRMRSIFAGFASEQRPFSLLENVNLHRDGRQVVLETNGVPIYGANGEFMGYRGMDRDITERKLAEKEKERLESQLRQAQKLEAIGTLAGGIAHDFNNILSPIIGYTEMVLDEVPESSPSRFDLNQVLSAAHRAKDLVKQILSFSRKGEEQLMRPVDVSVIVKEALKLLRASIPSTIEMRQNIQRVVAVVDATQIHQVVVNLCTNAVHAMEERGTLDVTLTKVSLREEDLTAMSLSAPARGSYLQLSIGDTGEGMDAKTLERIFEPYFTTKEMGKGTGLGLAVVHGIVKRHGGEIRVRSEVGKGSIFDIFIPAVEETQKQDTGPSQVMPSGSERILLVDDEPMIVRLSARMLEQLGYRVAAKTNPLEALDLFSSSPDAFDLIITDYTMPRMTGADLAKEVLKVRADIPIILCTGFSERVTETVATEMGIKGFAMKPLDKRQLAELVRRVLGGENR